MSSNGGTMQSERRRSSEQTQISNLTFNQMVHVSSRKQFVLKSTIHSSGGREHMAHKLNMGCGCESQTGLAMMILTSTSRGRHASASAPSNSTPPPTTSAESSCSKSTANPS